MLLTCSGYIYSGVIDIQAIEGLRQKLVNLSHDFPLSQEHEEWLKKLTTALDIFGKGNRITPAEAQIVLETASFARAHYNDLW